MDNSIKYSVNMPVYNTSNHLKESIESIINQSYQNWELIIVNDGSTDDSLEICKFYAKNDARIKILNQENKGLLQTRIRGRNFSSGDYLIFVDSDDFIHDKALEEVTKTINSTGADIVLYLYQRILNDGTLKDVSSYNFDGNNKSCIFESLLKTSKFNNLCLKAVKNELVRKDKINYEYLGHINQGEDLLQSVPLLYNAKKIVFLNKPLYYYRDNKDSITSNLSLKTIEDLLKVYDTIIKYLNDNRIEEKLIKSFNNRAIKNITRNYLIYSSQKNITKKDKKELMKTINTYEFSTTETNYKYIYKLIKAERFFTLSLISFFYWALKKMRKIFK